MDTVYTTYPRGVLVVLVTGTFMATGATPGIWPFEVLWLAGACWLLREAWS